MFFTDLVLDNGELVRIECPKKYTDEFYESIEHAMKLREWWCPSRFDGCKASFMGMDLDRVNIGKVVAML